MFTGIVEEIGSIKSAAKGSLLIEGNKVLADLELGGSIAVNGVCLTVIKIEQRSFAVEIMPETRRLTNLGNIHIGDKVNLERALSTQGRLGGHFVQGHVDGIGKFISLIPQEEAVIANISAPLEVTRYLVKKCFIAVNGVSLTVIDCGQSSFAVSLVTYSRKNTNLGNMKSGERVNLEVDIIAKYIEKFYTAKSQEDLTSLLYEYDYLKAR
ncbi:MAG: riboflavin synthase [Dehalococcoidia bacterium]|nr:riboflavin synthase [Dehalococcoidia bacterium]MDD5493061.1 riboflavin synthase [Dehalococcoidia bacterium]